MDIQILINEIKVSMEVIKKEQTNINKTIKIIEKKANKKEKIKETKIIRKPSGFAKPSSVSDELCNFFNKEKGTLMARTEVTKELNKYIKDNSLSESIWIKPNKELELLINTDKPIRFFEIQKYINHHFI